jgi:hypothetical protein
MKAIKPNLREPQGISERSDFHRHDPWLIASMASFNGGSARQSIRRRANRITKRIVRGMLAATAAAAIGFSCLLMTDNAPDARATATPAQSPRIAAAGAPDFSAANDLAK